jgi:hypothetical protein
MSLTRAIEMITWQAIPSEYACMHDGRSVCMADVLLDVLQFFNFAVQQLEHVAMGGHVWRWER